MATQQNGKPVFRVIDALDAPHGGRILRLRLQSGAAPSARTLKGARLRAVSPRGEERVVRVEGFPTFGGRPDARLRTGRVDVHVRDEDRGPPVELRWEVRLDDS